MTSKYPWDAWLDGRIWLLVEGTDFTCQPDSIRSMAWSIARKAQMELATALIAMPGGDPLRITYGVLLQAYDYGSTWRPNLTRFDREKLYRKHVQNNPR